MTNDELHEKLAETREAVKVYHTETRHLLETLGSTTRGINDRLDTLNGRTGKLEREGDAERIRREERVRMRKTVWAIGVTIGGVLVGGEQFFNALRDHYFN